MAETRPPAAAATNAGEPDPSMDDILASIRRILSEDEQANPQPPNSTNPVRPATDDVLDLDDTMLVAEPAPEPVRHRPPDDDHREDTGVMQDIETPTAGLIAPEAQTATANAMGSLRRTIEARASAASAPTLRSGGPTLEEVVRDELRPMLKNWLDANLPTMVERLVAAEIERLVARSAS